eukprot:2398057-Karenia_brevis.AAC.1
MARMRTMMMIMLMMARRCLPPVSLRAGYVARGDFGSDVDDRAAMGSPLWDQLKTSDGEVDSSEANAATEPAGSA